MGLTQSIDLAYETRIGREGVSEVELADALVRAAARATSCSPSSQLRPADAVPGFDSMLASAAGEPGFAGKTIGDLVAAQGRATAETLAKNGCPVRTIHLDRIDEASLGELLMHFMLETIVAAHLLGVDPFDQPAVEEGKVLAKRYLTGAA